MTDFVAKRIRFRNGERLSVLSRPGGLPVHEATLFLNRYRKRGRAANSIHTVCANLAFLHRQLSRANIDLPSRLRSGRFLTTSELSRLAEAAQYRVDDLATELEVGGVAQVVDIRRIGLRRKGAITTLKPVDVATHASRLRHMAAYLEFLSTYFGSALLPPERQQLHSESSQALKSFLIQVPPVTRRAKLGAREGLSKDEQDRLIAVLNPDSPLNPWKRPFVRYRNWVIVVLFLATGMRRGELLGLRVSDLHPQKPELSIYRRADASDDPRVIQPVAKTYDRQLELTPAVMRVVWRYVNHYRHGIKAARKHPFLFVADDGNPLSTKSIDKIFSQLRQACPGLLVRLMSHVMRHTWNERFSEQAELLKLPEAVEEKARNEQQGWSERSKMAATYTRRYVTKKGREISLKLQEQLLDPEA